MSIMGQMSEAVAEFKFVSEVTKQRSNPEAWGQLSMLRAMVKAGLVNVPTGLARRLLGVTKQRLHQLIDDGVLEVVEIDEHSFVTEASLVAYAKSERKVGRPVKAKSAEDALEAVKGWRKENI